jgi:protein subunit release factor B
MAQAEAHAYKAEWLEEIGGEEAGLKSATVRINGPDATLLHGSAGLGVWAG